MNHWDTVGELTRQHHADLEDEATRRGLASLVRPNGLDQVSRLALAWSAIRHLVHRDAPMTGRPCRLPDGSVGRIAVVEHDGDWVLVCRIA